MDNEEYGTVYYAKLFLLMIIPVYGFFFTMLLAFSKDVEDELKYLARGALIARIVFLIFVITGIAFVFSMLLPALNEFIAKAGLIRLFQ